MGFSSGQDSPIYFVVSPLASGFTDQLLQFGTFYKLGCSLGFTYVHVPFKSVRSSARINVRGNNFGANHDANFDVFEFLGFNQYLEKETRPAWPEQYKLCDVVLSDRILADNSVLTFTQISDYVKSQLNESVIRGSSDSGLALIVVFKLGMGEGRNHLLSIIHGEMPLLPDSVNLYSAYVDRRNHKPWRLRFVDKKLKMLVHIRQGDTAVIDTPWNTFIPVSGVKILKEYSRVEDIEREIVGVADYCNFVKKLVSKFEDDMFSIIFSSDGFQRAFVRLERNIHQYKFTREQVEALRKVRKHYDEEQYAQLDAVENSECIIGETSDNLKDLIHASLNANVIVIGTHQRMIPKLLAGYYNLDAPPVIILLYKNEEACSETLEFLSSEAAKIIYVNLNHVDIENITTQMRELLHL